MERTKIETYDPMLGQDYFLASKEDSFSSLKENLFVAEITGDIELDTLRSTLMTCVQATSTQAFFFIVPWYPVSKGLVRKIQTEFPGVSELEGSLCGYSDSPSSILDKLLSIRETHGGARSGEWTIGGCNEPFDSPGSKVWGFDYALDQVSKLGCLLHLGEMKQTVFISKLFEGLPKIQG